MKAKLNQCFAYLFAVAICLMSIPFVHAESVPDSLHPEAPLDAPVRADYSDSLLGPLGLNTVPNARMDAPGTIKAGVSALDPYLNGYFGIQLAKPLYVQLRQTAETSNILSDQALNLYPGLDLKLRLLKESEFIPELSVGMQAGIGERRMGGEYIVASKRYKNFDLSAGIGWGRFGSAGHFSNPFSFLGGDYSTRRDLDGNDTHEPSDWFSGDEIGLFGGIEYFTPIDGLSLKFDWGADRYKAEANTTDFDPAAPWGLGLNYSPTEWSQFAIATQGAEKVMGRIALKAPVNEWPGRRKPNPPKTPLKAFRTEISSPQVISNSAAQDGILLTHAGYDSKAAKAKIRLRPGISTPHQIGGAVIHMANNAGPDIEKLEISPSYMGLSGPKLSLLRRDFEKGLVHDQSSPEEIWRNTEFEPRTSFEITKPNRYEELQTTQYYDVGFTLENTVSLSEDDDGFYGRTAMLLDWKSPRLLGYLDAGFGLRVNLAENLDSLNTFRPRRFFPVRSDIDLFSQRRIALEHSYLAYTHSFRSDLHVALIGGYLEEMYAGIGGEVLYRPFNKRFALGAEAWKVAKRNPFEPLNTGFIGYNPFTAHVNAWYDVPHWDITLGAKLGRYLGEDVGGTLSLNKTFKNGAELEGFVTITDQRDFDLFGDHTDAYHGIKLNLPLGGFKYVPDNTKLTTIATPLGRDSGQMLNKPLSLYKLTEPFSYNHMIEQWQDILPDADIPYKSLNEAPQKK